MAETRKLAAILRCPTSPAIAGSQGRTRPHPGAAPDTPQRPDRPYHLRAPRTRRQAHGRRLNHRVSQRGRRRALRGRSPDRYDRAQRRRAAREAHRVARRHSRRRRRRGERRRSDGRRRQHRGATRGDREAGARSAFPRTPIVRSREGSTSSPAISARRNSRTSQSRFGSTRWTSQSALRRNPRNLRCTRSRGGTPC